MGDEVLFALPVELGTACECRSALALVVSGEVVEYAHGAGNAEVVTTGGPALSIVTGLPGATVVVVVVEEELATGITTVSAVMLVPLFMITSALAVGDVKPPSQDWTVGVKATGIENDDPDTG